MPGTVTVFCNMPMGLRLRLHSWQESSELVMGGGARKTKEARPTGAEMVINGTSAPPGANRKDADGNFVLLINGFAATPNVDKDFWDKWAEQNKEHPMMLHVPPLIYAQERPADARDQAKEYKGVRSGLEPLTPTLQDNTGRVIQADPRAPRGVSKHDGERAA